RCTTALGVSSATSLATASRTVRSTALQRIGAGGSGSRGRCTPATRTPSSRSSRVRYVPTKPPAPVTSTVPASAALVGARAALGLDAPVVVLDPHDVVELRGRDLDQVAVLERSEPVLAPHRDASALAGLELVDAHRAVVALELEAQLPAQHQDRLVLALVEL